MSNRSYVIVLVKQTFIHSWCISLQTFVNSVSNKQCSWTHIASRVQQTHASFPWLTRAVWAKRTEYSIEQIRQSLQRLKITKIVRMQNLHNFRTIDSVFFSTHACDISCQSLTHVYRALIRSGPSQRGSRRVVPRNHPHNQEDPSSVHDIWATIHM